MSKPERSPYYLAAKRLVSQHHDVTLTLETGGRHPKMIIESRGMTRTLPFPASPSDSSRGLRNHIRDVKHVLASMERQRRYEK